MTVSAPAGAPLSLVLALACAGCGTPRGPVPPSPGAPNPANLEALYLARTDSARARFSDADAHFVSGMIVHHGQAIAMSELAPIRAADPAIRILAARIINAQRDEIVWMEQWLRDRGQPIVAVDDPSHHERMPGMITPEQLADLERTRGASFDRLFLTFMIEHHRGAITMVQDLLDTPGAAQHPATFKLASDIHVDQTTEIARMEQMLAQIPPGDSR